MYKTCKKCGETKSLFDFYEHKGKRTSPGYRSTTCKKCHNLKSIEWAKANPEAVKKHRHKKKLKDNYGLSVEEYDKMFTEQEGKCFICSSPPTRRRLNVDHCHKTGVVRKLLCDKCNLALGLINDDLTRLEKVRKYLENFAT